MVERGDEKTHRCGAGGGDARGDGGAQHGGGGQGGEGGVDGGGGEADCVDGRVDGHVDGVASTGASTGASMRSVGASAGMCRAALPSPRLPAQLPRAPPRASPLPPAEEHAWVSRCCVVPPLLRCWAAGVAGAARLAVMPRAALHALGVVALLASACVLYRRRGGVAVASAASAARETAGARSQP